MAGRFVAVAVPVPALGLLSYSVPDPLAMPARGARVVVPLGRRTLTGIAMGEAAAPGGDIEIRDILDVLDSEPFLPDGVLELTDWIGEYYLSGPGATLAAAMPPNALTSRRDGFRTVAVASLTAAGLEAAAQMRDLRHVPDAGRMPSGARQREAIVMLAAAAGGVATSALAARGIGGSVISRLRSMGLVSIRRDRVDRDPLASARSVMPTPTGGVPELTAEQREVLQALVELSSKAAFGVALLHGVTGSGKTEVYLHLADAIRQQGRGVLMLVPEIALTPSIAAVFKARFGAQVAVQHSGLSDGERHDQWHRIRRGEVDVVVGTRSAVFAPLSRPGLIVVDEEHDASYKQEEMPRYNGRDVAIMRGKFAGALVLLGSATPSMESYANAVQGRYTLLTLARRVLNRPLAAVRIVNMREEYAEEGPDVIVSRSLRTAIADRLSRQEQAVVLLNRRGFAVAVFCRQCGHTVECRNCSVSLTVHTARQQWRSRCHYCGFAGIVPKQCPQCAAPYLEHVGFGTERLEKEIANLFPDARVARVDRDTVRRRGSLTNTLGRFARRELDVIVGTQMIAKGHDFPHVTLVGVVSADVGLGLADFRAAERTFQLLTQVAGRAGRGEQPGEAIVQTFFPGHYSIRLATTQDHRAFYEKEIAFRSAMRYPPTVAMINVVMRGRTYDQAMGAAATLARATGEQGSAAGGFVVLGPAPAPLTRLRGEHRAQFFLKGTSRRAMRSALRAALESHPELARRAVVDVDPLNVL